MEKIDLSSLKNPKIKPHVKPVLTVIGIILLVLLVMAVPQILIVLLGLTFVALIYAIIYLFWNDI